MHGSRKLSLGFGLAGLIALTITALMNLKFGISQGATDDGQHLLGAAAIVIDIAGLVLFGLGAGALMGRNKKIAATLVMLVMVACAIFSVASVMGFVASERLSIARAREAQSQSLQARQDAAQQASKERRAAQLRMTEGYLDWTKKTIRKDDLGRRERKDLLDSATKAIASVNQADAQSAAESAAPVIIIRPDGQAEIISELSGFEQKTIQLTIMLYMSVLLIVIKSFSFPLAAYFWAAPAIGLAMAAGIGPAAPAPLPPPNGAAPLQLAPPRGTGVSADGTTPVPTILPPVRKIVETPKQAAQNFVRWCRATERASHRFWGDAIDEVYSDYCKAENRAPVRINDFRAALKNLGKREVVCERGKAPSGNKLTYYEIVPAPRARPPAPAIDRAGAQDAETDPKKAAPPGGGRPNVIPFGAAALAPPAVRGPAVLNRYTVDLDLERMFVRQEKRAWQQRMLTIDRKQRNRFSRARLAA